MMSVMARLSRQGKGIDYERIISAPFEERLQAAYDAFFGYVFERFNAIRDIRGCYEFQQWYLENYQGGADHDYMEILKLWECIHLGMYRDAIYYANRARSKLLGSLNRKILETNAIELKEMARQGTADSRRRLEKEMLDQADELGVIIGLLEQNETHELCKRAQQMIDLSRDVCVDYFGKKVLH